MTILGNGSVGIGTANPTAKLHISTVTVGEDLLFLRDQINTADLTINSPSGALMEIKAGVGDHLQLSSGATANQGIRIRNDGNVGIGTTTPASLLTIGANKINMSSRGDINMSGDLIVGRNVTVSGNVAIGTGITNFPLQVNGDMKLYGDVSNTGRLFIDKASLAYRAQIVYQSLGTTRWVAGLADSNGAGLDGTEYFIGTTEFTTRIAANNIEYVALLPNGNFGIGTTNPQYLLHVTNGTRGKAVNLSGVLYVNDSSENVGIGTSSPDSVLHIKANFPGIGS